MSTHRRKQIEIAGIFAALLAVLGGFIIVRHHDGAGRNPNPTSMTLASLPEEAISTAELTDGSTVRRLAAVLDKSQLPVKSITEIADRHGLDAAFAKIREFHQRTPEQPVLPHGLSRTSPDKVIAAADGIIAGGWRFGKREAYPVETPIDWAADPYHDRGWRMWLNAWRVLEPVLAAYDETKERRYLEFANEIALDWVDQHIFAECENPYAWYDMAIGRRALFLGKLIDANLRNNVLAHERILDLFVAARRHALELHDEEKIVWHSNHGIYQLVGLLSLAKSAPELKGAREFERFAKQGLRKLLGQHFTDEGIHREHSPFYHVALINTVGLLVEHGLIDDKETLDLFRRASRNIVWLSHPNGYLVRNGDGDQTLAADRIIDADDPQLRYLISEGEKGTPPTENYRIFHESGYAVFRGPWDYRPWNETPFLFFSAAFHSRTHKHADDFTIEWSELGRTLLIDGGRYTYKYDHPSRQYVESTRAHNTVEIDGRDFSRYNQDAFGSAIVDGGESGGAFFVEAQLHRKRFFDTHHRRILVYRPGLWLTVVDHLTSPEPHDFAQCFHFDPELEFQTTSGRGIAADLPQTGAALKVVSLAPLGAVTPQLIKGQTEPRLQGWTSLAANELIPNYALELKTRGNDVLYVTLLALTDKGTTIQPGRTVLDDVTGNLQVRWHIDGAEEGFDFQETQTGRTINLIQRTGTTAEKPGKRIR